jgi:LytR cell envelope-related transcriptional attenuator
VDHPAPSSEALVRPWRTATLIASTVAAIELVALVGAGVALVAKPLARHMRAEAEARAFTPVKKRPKVAPIPAKPKEMAPRLARTRVSVLVLNGNGRQGAAASAASRLSVHGYRVGSTANAKRTDYATSVVMYRPGYRPEGLRLAHDLRVKVVGPLDGMKTSDLRGAKAVLIVGAE